MSEIEKVFKEGKPFIGYLVAGDGGIDYSVKAALAMIKGGVGILELGIPFSDPIGDGEVIQRAAQRAIKNKIGLNEVIDVVKGVREKTDVPLVLMSYFNPLYTGGVSFLKKAKKAGVDGILIVDLPMEEEKEYFKAIKQLKLDSIFLLSPSTKEVREQKIINRAKGFLYYACQKGTTGERKSLPKDLAVNLKKIKCKTKKPVVVGFGIGSRKDAKEVLKHADGFVVGSAFVKLIEKKASFKAITDKAKELKP